MAIEIGQVENGVIVNAIVADSVAWAETELGGTWVDLTGMAGVGIGWGWDGTTATPPPAPAPVTRFILSGTEWVEAFSDQEWKWLKAKRQEATAAGERLDQMMDAIRWTNSIDVSSPNMDEFYAWMVSQGIPGGQTRIDELRAGVVE